MKPSKFLLLLSFCLFGVALHPQVSQEIDFSTSDISIHHSNNRDRVWLKGAFSLSGEGYVGQPEVPVKTINLILPKGTKASAVLINGSQETTIVGSFTLPLVKAPVELSNPGRRSLNKSKEARITVQNPFPDDPLLSFENHQYRNYSYVSISFSPLNYTIQTHSLKLFQKLNITVTTTSSATEIPQSLRPSGQSDYLARQSLKNSVANPQQFQQFYAPLTTFGNGDTSNPNNTIFKGRHEFSRLPSKWGGAVPYVIITNNTTVSGEPVGDLVGKFQGFADWKTRKGTPAKVVTVDTIKATYTGGDTQEKIRKFIQDAYLKWNTRYILLGGSGNIVPTRKIHIHTAGEKYTDLYYSAIVDSSLADPYSDNWNANGDASYGSYGDDSEFTPDIDVGRAPVNSPGEAEAFRSKNLSYARTVLAPNGFSNSGAYLGRVLGVYGIAFLQPEHSSFSLYSTVSPFNAGFYNIRDHRQHADSIYGMFEYYEDWDQDSINGVNNLDYHHSWGLAYWPLHENEGAYTNEEDNEDNVHIDNADITHQAVMDQINNGYGIINIIDHGGPNQIGIATQTQSNYLRADDFENLLATNKYGLMIAGDCFTAPVNRETYIGERWVNSPNGGVAFLGNADKIYASTSINFNKDFFDYLYDENTTDFHLSALRYNTIFENGNSNELYKQYQLLGDPELSLYTHAPINAVTVSGYANSITIGHHSNFDLQVSGLSGSQKTLISVYKKGEVAASGYISTDTIFDITPDTEGWLYITATAHNHEPFEDSIQVVQPANKVHLYKNNFTLTDENGNGVVEPGEEINLKIQLRNSGGQDATGISAVLSSPDPNLTVPTASSSSDYPDISSGTFAPADDFYSFTAPSSDTIRAIPLLLTITSDQGDFKEPFLLNTKSADLQLGDRYVTSDADNFDTEVHTFTQGNEVHIAITVNNQGLATAESVSGVLSTNLNSSIASVDANSPTANYGDVDPQDHSDNTGEEFIVDIGNAYNGNALPFTLTLTDGFGATKDFAIDLTDYPGTVTWLEYTSSSDYIKPTWDYDLDVQGDIKGFNVYRSATENGTYEKVNDLILTASTFDDLNLEPLTEYWYKISVVSPTGDERPLNELTGYFARTKIGKHEGFPIAANPAVVHGAESSPTVYDIDGDGTKEIFVAYRNSIASDGIAGRLMGFKESGEELFDIDDDPNKVYGFAGTEKQLYAKPAVGDLEGDGQAEVLVAGRGLHQDPKWGSLYGFRTTDQDGDGKPDRLWDTDGEREIHQKIFRNPVLADLDNDGTQEILVQDEHQQVHVHGHDGNNLGAFQIDGPDYSEGQLAVADIDNDGYKEVVIGVAADSLDKGALYTWNPDGDYSVAPTLLHQFDEGERADGGLVLADIDKNNKYELLTITREGSTGRVYALNIETGQPISQIWNGARTLEINSDEASMIPRIAVGDIIGDDHLEVVYGSADKSNGNCKLYALHSNGSPLNGFPILSLSSLDSQSPILADIDDDDDVEIIVNSIKHRYHNGVYIRNSSILKAYNPDGTTCTGWDLTPDTETFFVGSPYVGDIDNDNKNEVVISSGDNATYVWNTQGDADKVEWGSYRHDAQNTGAYEKADCLQDNSPSLDLAMQDSGDDTFEEPNTNTSYPWHSRDIWVRNQQDGIQVKENENPEYDPNNPSYVYVHITNNSCVPSHGNDQLKLYWAKASTGLSWPSPWGGNTYAQGAKMGNTIGSHDIPVIDPGEDIILKFPWDVPNPDDYSNLNIDDNPWHFCLLGRIVSTDDPMTFTETSDLTQNVLNNNNIGWKNVTVVDIQPNHNIRASFAMANLTKVKKGYDLDLEKGKNRQGNAIFNEAEIRVQLSDEIYAAWKDGGAHSSNLKRTKSPHVFLVADGQAKFENIILDKGEIGTVGLQFNFLTEKVDPKNEFIYNAVQRVSNRNKVVGGETFVIKKKTRNLFYAQAEQVGNPTENDSVTISASLLDEPAKYNWYDPDGNLIYTGEELKVDADIAKKYKLEIIADADGYKDYKQIDVPATVGLGNLTPNPATTEVTVHYNLKDEDSAYLMVTHSVSGVSNNYILDSENTAITIDLSGYPTGVYVVSLIRNGENIGTQNLLKN